MYWVFVAAWAFLLFWLVGATLCCSIWASHCRGFSCWAQAVGAGSVVVAHGFTYPEACGIFQNQGSNPCPLHWQADSYPQTTREVLFIFNLKNSLPCLQDAFLFLNWSTVFLKCCVSAVQQNDSALHMHISPLFRISFPLRSPQSAEESSRCCTVGSQWLSFIYSSVYMGLPWWLSSKEPACSAAD